MEIRVKGLLTATRLRELLALIEASTSVTCHFDGRLQLRAAQASPTSAMYPDHSVNHRGAEEAQPEEDLELEEEEDQWDGPLPTYISGVVDNSPEELERRRLLKEQRQSLSQRQAEAYALKKRLFNEHTMDKELFGRLRLRYGQPFIAAINAEIAATWREVNPIFSHNCKDGRANQPRPMPQLELRSDSVYFHGFNVTGSTKKIATPVSVREGREGAGPHWKYKEWVEHAVPRIRAVINEYAEKAQLVKVGIKADSST